MDSVEDHEKAGLIDRDPVESDLEHAGLTEAHSFVSMAQVENTGLRRVRRYLVAFGALTLLSAALATAVTNSLSPPAKANVGSIVEEFGGAVGAVLGVVTTAAHGMQLVGAVGTSMGQIENVVHDANKTYKIIDGEYNLTHAQELAALEGNELLGANNLHDGNPCPDNEEESGGLCYERCSDLTRGIYPVRSSAFSCCKQEPCNAFNSVFSNPLKFCHGLDVGRLGGGPCPHSLGDCLLNEEFLLGFCYRKCALLTNGEYPFRTTADTCCKSNLYLACSDPSFTLTNATFSVGGGQGDDLLQADAGQVHAPLLYVAEAQTSTTLLALQR